MIRLPESLETDRLVLRQLKYEDAEEIFYAYASKLEATKYVSWPVHESVSDTNSYLKQAIAAWQTGTNYTYSIRTRKDNRLIGSIGVVNEAGKMHFGYIISPTCWNQGFATEACKVILHELTGLDDVYRIWTFVDVDNKASIRVLHKLGLEEEARLKKWFRFINQQNQPKDCILYRLPM